MKKATIVTLALVLVLAASTFASAANYIGGGIGIIGFKGQPASASEAADAIPFALTLAADFDVMDKLTVSANGYLGIKKAETTIEAGGGLSNYVFTYMVGGYAKYSLANLDALKLGAVVGANYNKNFAPNTDPATEGLNYGAGVFAEQPLGETGTIFGQVMYWVKGEEGAKFTDHIGGLGGINFKITEKIAVKGQVEYVNKHALFSIGAGYAF
jgi:hypothetical protein